MNSVDPSRPVEPIGGRGWGASITPRLFFGFAVILAGILLLLDQLNLFESDEIIGRYWPVLIILFSLARFSSGRILAGLVWLFVGVWLQLERLDIVSVSLFDLWPVFLILLGLSIVSKSMRGRGLGGGAIVDTGDSARAFALLSGVNRKFTSTSFHGGDATAIMGGCELDLRQASIGHSPVVVDVLAIWGGVDLIVPSDWSVKSEAVVILGGISDTRKEISPDPNKVLVVRGMALMGGIEIKN